MRAILAIPFGQGHHVVHHGTAGRIGGLASSLEESGVDPLADDDVGELQLVWADPGLGETLLREDNVVRKTSRQARERERVLP